LLKMLVMQENYEGKDSQTTKTSLEYKHIQLLLLEETAQCIDYFLPHQLRSLDIETEAWFTKKAKRIATALRQKKRWILTPRTGTSINFAKSIVTTLSYISNGNWNSLEQIEPKMVPNPKLWKSGAELLVKVFRTALLAVAPIVIFIVFQMIKLP